ncbi:hypothetical protein PG985_011428 [Apiospora marii]|uniref:uncharacterized protein n=1 Tax=Apiospora marii TaxID=335849 RepID=UPI00312F8BA0
MTMGGLNLLELPGELQDSILLQHCDGVDRLFLRRTCRRLREIITPPLALDIAIVERGDLLMHVPRTMYVCFLCAKLQHRSRFADDMVEGARAICGQDAATRFCLDCGLFQKYTRFDTYRGQMETVTRYGLGQIITIGGSRYIVCLACGDSAGADVTSPRHPMYKFLSAMKSHRKPEHERFCLQPVRALGL